MTIAKLLNTMESCFITGSDVPKATMKSCIKVIKYVQRLQRRCARRIPRYEEKVSDLNTKRLTTAGYWSKGYFDAKIDTYTSVYDELEELLQEVGDVESTSPISDHNPKIAQMLLSTRELLLIAAIEECGELIQELSKVLRFGSDGCHPDEPELQNVKRVMREYHQLEAVIALLQTKGILPHLHVTERQRIIGSKWKRLGEYHNIKWDAEDKN